jgi:uncharacterized Tic20 family protein
MTQDNPTPPPQDPVPPTATPVDYAAPTGNMYAGPPPTADDKNMAMLAHLLSIFTGFLGPLIIWLVKKDTSPFVDDQGKEALNFQLTLLIAYFVGGITACLFIGFFIVLAAWVCGLIFAILGTLKAKDGIAYRYPMTIRMIK